MMVEMPQIPMDRRVNCMRSTKWILLLAACALCVCLAAFAQDRGPLAEAWNSGCDFLFHTDNVTVTGEAVFSLDGEYFKTARLQYKQDGFKSYYDLDLFTPKEEGGEQETGWIIIAGEEGNFDVMERYEPGFYRSGTGTPHNTLLRSSVQLDALTELVGVLVNQLEGTLPEGMVTAKTADGKETIHFSAADGQLPPAAVSALNAAAAYLSNRWFSYGQDRAIVGETCVPFENYVTVSQALTDGTVRWTLRAVDADVTLDAQGRLTAVQGKLQAASTFWDGAVREVEVQFSLAASDYGVTAVQPFDPEEFNVIQDLSMYGEDEGADEIYLSDEEWDQWLGRAKTLLESQGYKVSPEASLGGWGESGIIKMTVENPEGDAYFCAYTEDGNLLTLQNLTGEWLWVDEKDLSGVDEDEIARAKEFVLSFLRENHPVLADAIRDLTAESVMETEDGSRYMKLDSGDSCLFVVRLSPSLRMEYSASDSNG